MDTAVYFKDFSLFFAEQQGLHSLSFSVPRHSLSVLVGRSGSGKTSILRSINRLNEELTPCSHKGELFVNYGKGLQNVYSLSATELLFMRQKVAMLFQTPQLFPLSIRKNMTVALRRLLGDSKDIAEQKMEKNLKLVGLWDDVKNRLNSSALSLSGGQQQRLCLARVLSLEPEILLLDEPTSSLDIVASKSIELLLVNLAKQCTILMVSHSLEQARQLADHIFVCRAGRIVDELSSLGGLNISSLSEVIEEE